MTDVLRNTQNWLAEFTSKWEKVLCKPADSSPTLHWHVQSPLNTKTLTSLNFPRLNTVEFVDLAEEQVFQIKTKHFHIQKLCAANDQDRKLQQTQICCIDEKLKMLHEEARTSLKALQSENTRFREALQAIGLPGFTQYYETEYKTLYDQLETLDEVTNILNRIECTHQSKAICAKFRRFKKLVETLYAKASQAHSELSEVPRKYSRSSKCLESLFINNQQLRQKHAEVQTALACSRQSILALQAETSHTSKTLQNLQTKLADSLETNTSLHTTLDKLHPQTPPPLHQLPRKKLGLQLLTRLQPKLKHDFQSTSLLNQLRLHFESLYNSQHEAMKRENRLSRTTHNPTTGPSLIFSFFK